MNRFSELVELLKKDIENAFPSECESDGGGAAAFMMLNAPTVIISRNRNLPERLVPVFFIACRRNGDNCSEEMLSDIYQGSGRVALLRHLYEGAELGKCIVVPFLFHMQSSAKEFCAEMERYFEGLQPDVDIAWHLEYCHVRILHNGMEYVPSGEVQSLRN